MFDPRTFAKRSHALALALAVASAVSVALLIVRVITTGNAKYSFLIWNLFLAWVPLMFAWASFCEMDRPKKSRLLLAGCLGGWFFFFPNAPYLVTDLVHLKSRGSTQYWYDLMTLMSFAWTGLFLGYCSLFLMHLRVRQRLGDSMGWAFVGIMLALGSFGIYLGRFLRWNSWDVVLKPMAILKDAAQVADLEMGHLAGFSLTFFVFSAAMYLMMYALTHWHAPDPAPIMVRADD